MWTFRAYLFLEQPYIAYFLEHTYIAYFMTKIMNTYIIVSSDIFLNITHMFANLLVLVVHLISQYVLISADKLC